MKDNGIRVCLTEEASRLTRVDQGSKASITTDGSMASARWYSLTVHAMRESLPMVSVQIKENSLQQKETSTRALFKTTKGMASAS